jgi:MFS family permease
MLKNYRLLLIFNCFLLGLSLIYTQLYLACLPTISHSLSISKSLVQFAFSFNIFGFGLSQLFYGPCSEQYGRKPCLLIGLVLACVGNLISAFSVNETMLISGQLISGLGAGSCSIMPRVVLKDVFVNELALARAFSLLAMTSTIATGFSPLIGSWIKNHFGWHVVFLILVAISIIVFIFEKIWVKETLPQKTTLLNWKLISLYFRIYSDNRFFVYATLNAVMYSSLVIYLLLTPFIFQRYFGMTSNQNAYVYLACATSYFLGSLCLNILLKHVHLFTIMYFAIGLAFCALIGEWHVAYHLSVTKMIACGLLIHFSGGILAPITYTEILTLTTFLPGLTSAAINAARVFLAFFLSSMSVIILKESFNIVPALLIILAFVTLLSLKVLKK